MTEETKTLGRPRLFKTPDDMKQAVEKYFKGRKIITMTGLARALKMTRMSLVHYKRRDGYDEILEDAKQKVEEFWETQLLRRGAAFGVAFNLKNSFGWRDQLDIESNNKHEHNFPKLTPEEAANVKKAFEEEF